MGFPAKAEEISREEVLVKDVGQYQCIKGKVQKEKKKEIIVERITDAVYCYWIGSDSPAGKWKQKQH